MLEAEFFVLINNKHNCGKVNRDRCSSMILLIIREIEPLMKDGQPWDQSRDHHAIRVTLQECNRFR